MSKTPLSKAIRKTYTLTQLDLEAIGSIKDKLLDKKQVVSDSQIIRMGLSALTALSPTELLKLIQAAPSLLKKAKT